MSVHVRVNEEAENMYWCCGLREINENRDRRSERKRDTDIERQAGKQLTGRLTAIVCGRDNRATGANDCVHCS